MSQVRIRRLALVAALAALLAGAGCAPITNAPPGGGEIVHEKFRVGPLTMQPYGQWGDTAFGYQVNLPRPSGAFGIKSMNFDIVDAAGNPVPRHDAHLHHIVMGSSAARDSYCAGNERFAGAGAERNPIILPDPYAYMVGPNDSWSATWEVVNEASRAQTVYIEYDVGYQRGATAQNSRGVRAFFLDVAGCTAAYNVPGNGGPGSIHTQTRTWTAPFSGYLVTAVGHMHGGGIDLTLRDDDRGVTCTMTASYEEAHSPGHENPPHAITRCPVHVRVEQGQRFSVISRYDNSQPVQGAMGIVRAYAWPGNQ
jgi:Stress up-regulated Nod 19